MKGCGLIRKKFNCLIILLDCESAFIKKLPIKEEGYEHDFDYIYFILYRD